MRTNSNAIETTTVPGPPPMAVPSPGEATVRVLHPTATGWGEAARAALDWIDLAIFVVDEEGRVLLENRAAEELLAQRDGLALGPDRELRGATAPTTRRLRQLFEEAGEPGEDDETLGTLRLTRPSGRPPLTVFARPLPAHLAGARMICVEVPERAAPSRGTLRKVYKFTRVEAEVAIRLASAATPKQISTDLGIGINTVRGHLKSLFSKTKTHRQAELVHLLLTGPTRLLD